MSDKSIPMTLSYTGEVKFSYKRNDKVFDSYYHNAGLPGLFKLLCKALAGKDISGEIPSYVDLRASADGTSYSSILSQVIPLSGGLYYQSGSEWLYRASATIPFASLASAIDENGSYRLYLISRNTGVELAHVDVNATDLVLITPGTQALIEWVLRFQNLNGKQSS